MSDDDQVQLPAAGFIWAPIEEEGTGEFHCFAIAHVPGAPMLAYEILCQALGRFKIVDYVRTGRCEACERARAKIRTVQEGS